jgi:hypothetical protein
MIFHTILDLPRTLPTDAEQRGQIVWHACRVCTFAEVAAHFHISETEVRTLWDRWPARGSIPLPYARRYRRAA